MSEVPQRLEAALGERYELVRELGRGGMAIVFLAEDLRHHRRVAIKVLKSELAQSLGAERFLREIEIAARLNHPHILPLHDSGATPGCLYYVMPYVEGESLRDRLDREKQLSLEDAVRVAREVAGALSYAHALGLVHRDIKPENILLQAGHAVVSDFGIARAVGASGGEKLTATGIALGTPAYMSLEQASGGSEIDARADIYALGCVLYEMLTGDPPYSGATPQAILARRALEPIPGVRVVRDTVPVDLERVILRALARMPADRYQTAGQFARELDRVAQELDRVGVTERAVPSATVVSPARPRSHSFTIPLAAAVTAVLATGGWWFSRQPDPAGPALRSLAVLPFENLTGDSGEVYLAAGMHDALIGELARLSGLQVISRRSVIRYAEGDKPITQIARELNVDGVVAVSFRRTGGDSVRIGVQLFDAVPEERSLWADVYHREVTDGLVVHGEIAGAIGRAIGIPESPQQATRTAGRRRMSREAYEAYLRGRFAITQGTPDAVQQGLAYLHEANERDPADPYPYVGLAMGYSILGHGPRPDVLPRAIAAAQRALELDSTLAEPYAVLAQAKLYKEWDWAGAEQAFRRALALNPTLADARAHYAWYFDLLGPRDRALEEMRRAIESDPLDPLWPAWLASLYLSRDRFDEAIAEARKALELNPNLAVAHGILGRSLTGKGLHNEAIATQERALSLNPRVGWGLVHALAAAGRLDEARELVARLEADGPGRGDTWGMAIAHTAIGDHERALYWLERAFEVHPFAPWTRQNRDLAPLRENPRFRALVQRLNLP